MVQKSAPFRKTAKGLCCFETSCDILRLLSVNFYIDLKKYPIILIGHPPPPCHPFFTSSLKIVTENRPAINSDRIFDNPSL